MRLDENVFYHGGWILGVGWVLLGFLQVYLGIQFGMQTDSSLADHYQWLGLGMTVLGVVWLLFWYLYAREFVGSASEQ